MSSQLLKENKENQYLHEVQISPEKQRKAHRHVNILQQHNSEKVTLQPIPFGSMKKRKQL
jgi:hypothetical protein